MSDDLAALLVPIPTGLVLLDWCDDEPGEDTDDEDGQMSTLTARRSWNWMTGSRCQDCGREARTRRGWADPSPDSDDESWYEFDFGDHSCREAGHTVRTWYGPEATADQTTAAAIERWWQRYAYNQQIADLMTLGTPEAVETARCYADRLTLLNADMPHELNYRVQVDIPDSTEHMNP